MKTLQELTRPNIWRLKPYSSARDEYSGAAASVFLDANENPYNLPHNRYPDPMQRDLKLELSKIKKVAPAHIFLGNGSDEAIDLVFRAFCEPGRDNVVAIDPTYGMYQVCADVNDVEYRKVLLHDDFQFSADELLAVADERTKMIFLCSPNNPTGNDLLRSEIIKVINDFEGLVILDEAYNDFSDEPSFLSELGKYPNLIILQTFSKAFGCAAIRLGMAFASEGIIGVLNKIKYPYNVNQLTQQQAIEMLHKYYEIERWVKTLKEERGYLEEAFVELPCVLQVFPSNAYPKVFRNLGFIRSKLDFEFVMVTNQDGLGTSSFPEETFWPAHNLMLKTLAGEGITFDDILIDRSMPEDCASTRKPRTGMLTKYISNPEYDLEGSFVIGDRPTDVELAKNIGCRAIYLQESIDLLKEKRLETYCALATTDWDRVAEFLFAGERRAEIHRTTKETDILVALNLDGKGTCDISTGLGFFDHMLEQIGKHSGMDLTIRVKGDLEVDEHHTIEDTAIALGECIYQALGSKRGIERYGYALPMDDCLCRVCLDFGGRPWLVWDAEFKREKIGEMPTEMFLHFFKSLSDAAKMNLNIKAEGQNEHHKIEGIFKALARALKMALKRDIYHFELPSSKGVL